MKRKFLIKQVLFQDSLEKKNWEIFFREIKSIKSLPTSQGSKVYYFVDEKGKNILLPQRIENFDKFLYKIKLNTNLDVEGISYISPLWTYKFLTIISVLMIFGEISFFLV